MSVFAASTAAAMDTGRPAATAKRACFQGISPFFRCDTIHKAVLTVEDERDTGGGQEIEQVDALCFALGNACGKRQPQNQQRSSADAHAAEDARDEPYEGAEKPCHQSITALTPP